MNIQTYLLIKYSAVDPAKVHKTIFSTIPTNHTDANISNLTDLGYSGRELSDLTLDPTDKNFAPVKGIQFYSPGEKVSDEYLNSKGVKGRKGVTLYVDDDNNVVKRSKGNLYGRRALGTLGTIGGAAGGYYLGTKSTDWLANKLGLDEDNTFGRTLRGIGTLGGTIGGAYLGGRLGHRFGGYLGDKIAPQKGKAVTAYPIYYGDK